MPVYKIADLKVEYEPQYDLLRTRSEKYLCNEPADFNVSIAENTIKEKMEFFKGKAEEKDIEYILIGSAFNYKLLDCNGMFLHSSTVVVDGKAYSFSADCGTGKSTHTSLWLKLFGEKAFIINDDKAAYRKIDGKYYVYGTPFSGKHDINENTSAELKAICFIERAKENSIERMDIDEAVSHIIPQTVRPAVPERMIEMCDFIDMLIREIPIYKLKCNMDISAAELSYKVMST
ncbi:MAG: hypothetical protein KBT46_02205 [Ruminococcus sp.]|nr:hypothetical protein [Candidatus Copronaster equi]